MKEESKGKKFDLMDFALKHQKATFITILIFGGLFIVYALIFSTPFYELSYYANPEGLMYARGAEIYFEIQPFNRMLLNIALIQMVFIIGLFIYFAQKRRIYYLSNYITIGLYVMYSAFISIYSIVNIIGIRAKFVKIDFKTVELLANIAKQDYTDSTFMMDIGLLLSVLSLALSAFLVIVAVAKYKSRKKELELKAAKLSEQTQTEVTQENA